MTKSPFSFFIFYFHKNHNFLMKFGGTFTSKSKFFLERNIDFLNFEGWMFFVETCTFEQCNKTLSLFTFVVNIVQIMDFNKEKNFFKFLVINKTVIRYSVENKRFSRLPTSSKKSISREIILNQIADLRAVFINANVE